MLHAVGFSESTAASLQSMLIFSALVSMLLQSFIGTYFTPSQVLLTLVPLTCISHGTVTTLVYTGSAAKPGLPFFLLCASLAGAAGGLICAYPWLMALYAQCQKATGFVIGMVMISIAFL